MQRQQKQVAWLLLFLVEERNGHANRADRPMHWSLKKTERMIWKSFYYGRPTEKTFDQPMANALFPSFQNLLIPLCVTIRGRWAVRELISSPRDQYWDLYFREENLPLAVFSRAIIRLIPGVLNDETSRIDRFLQDGLFSTTVYTRPAGIRWDEVPGCLLFRTWSPR